MLDALDQIAGSVALLALFVATAAMLAALTAWRRASAAGSPSRPQLEDDPSMERYVIAQAEKLEELSGAVASLSAQAATWGRVDGAASIAAPADGCGTPRVTTTSGSVQTVTPTGSPDATPAGEQP